MRHQAGEPAGELRVRLREILDAHLEILAIGIDGAEHDPIPEHHLEVDYVGWDLDAAVSSRNARQADHAVGPSLGHGLERHHAVARTLQDEVDLAKLIPQPGDRVVIDAVVVGSGRCDHLSLDALGRIFRVHVHLELLEPEQHGAHDADGSCAEHDCSFWLPEHPLLDLPCLVGRLFDDAERLEQDGVVAHRGWDLHQEVRLLAVVLAHIAVGAFDAPLRVVAGEAHVALAGLAVRAAVRPAHCRHHQVTRLKSGNSVTDRLDQAQRFVPYDQHIRPGRGLAV